MSRESVSGGAGVDLYDGFIDVTDRVEQYETGKTFTCDCGQGIGVEYGVKTVRCGGCKEMIVDRNGGSREPPADDDPDSGSEDMDTQSSLGDFA